MSVQVPEGFVLKPGKAQVSSIDVVHNTTGVLIVSIDMISKYVEPFVSLGDDRAEVCLQFDEPRSLRPDFSATGETWLLLPEHTAGWNVMVEGGRYTITIIAWKDLRL